MKPADSKRFEFSDFSSIVLEFAHLYYITLKSICSFVPGLFQNQPGLTKALVFVLDLVFVLEHEQLFVTVPAVCVLWRQLFLRVGLG